MHVLDEVLGFAPDGKLEKLCLAGFPNLLNEWKQDKENLCLTLMLKSSNL
jgi:hypothetical protein